MFASPREWNALIVAFPGQPAIGGRFLQFGTGRLDEIENCLKVSRRLLERMAPHHNTHAAMLHAAMVESKFHFGPFHERPLGE